MKRIFFSSTLMWSAPLQDMAQVVQDNQLAGMQNYGHNIFFIISTTRLPIENMQANSRWRPLYTAAAGT